MQPAPLGILRRGASSPAFHSLKPGAGARQSPAGTMQMASALGGEPSLRPGLPLRTPEAEVRLSVAAVTSSHGLRMPSLAWKEERESTVLAPGHPSGGRAGRSPVSLAWPSPLGSPPAPRPLCPPPSFLPRALLWLRAHTWFCHSGSLLPVSPHHLSSLIPEPVQRASEFKAFHFGERCQRRVKEAASTPLQGWKGVHAEILPA